MNNPNLRIKSVPQVLVNPSNRASSEARFAPLCVVVTALVWLAALASATTSASAQAVNFGSVNVCPSGKTTPSPCSATQTLTFSIAAGTIVRSIAIVTTGAPNLDFQAEANDSSTTLCKVQTYTSATTCTLDVTFAPLTPGLRKGAAELIDGNTVIATTYVYGTGTGPQIAFAPAMQTIPGGTIGNYGPAGIAVDGSGNIFFINGDITLQEILAAGGYTTINTLGTGFYGRNLAIDGAGNIFATGQGEDTPPDDQGHVTELLAANSYATQKTLSKAFINPSGIAVDSSGNLFVIAEELNGSVVDEMLATGGYHTVNVVASGFIAPYGVAVDASSNIFVADANKNAVEEFFAASGYTTSQTVYSTAEIPQAVAIDSVGNLYVANADAAAGEVVEVLAAGGYTTIEPLVSALNDPLGVAVDSSGDVFVGNSTGGGTTGNIQELHRSLPPAFAFPTTTVDGASSPQTATVQNIGNATLTASSVAFTDPDDFALVAGSGTPEDCSATFSLAANAECSLNIEFTPQSAGPLSGSLVLTDNTGNAAAGIQSITVSGTGTTPVIQISPSSLDFGSIPYPATATQSVTISNTGSGTLTVDPSSNGRGAVITGNTCASGVAGGKSCTLQVEFKPVELGYNHNTVTIATNAALSPKVPVTGTATGVGSLVTQLLFDDVDSRNPFEILPLTVTNYGVSGTVTVATETGAKNFSVFSNGCTSGITAGNSCTIQVEYSPAEYGTQTAYLKLIPSTGPEQIIVLEGLNPIPE